MNVEFIEPSLLRHTSELQIHLRKRRSNPADELRIRNNFNLSSDGDFLLKCNPLFNVRSRRMRSEAKRMMKYRVDFYPGRYDRSQRKSNSNW